MITKRFRGFTLIELLVVIAIIGILSAVVLASLNTARSKGSDAAIQSDLATIQTQSEIFYGQNANTYGTPTTKTDCSAETGTLFADSNVASAITGITTSGSGGKYCSATATAYVAAAQLKTDATKYWCVDSTGVAKQDTVPTTTACP